MDDERKFLEAQVQKSENGVETAFNAIKAALGDFDASFDDLVTWRKALAKYTRDSDNPYQPPPLSNPLNDLLAGRVQVEEKSEGKQERQKQEERPKPPPKFSKRGAVRDFLRAQERGLDVSEIFHALPQADYPEPITKADLYRILPGLYARGEADRDARGKYSAVRPKGESENGLFEGVKETVM